MQHADGVVTLEIAACRPSDSGKYTCHASNALGEAKTIADVLVEDRRIPPPSSSSHQRVSSVNRRGQTPPPIFFTTSPPVQATISGPSERPPLQHATHTTAKLYSSNFSINTNRYLRRSYKLPPAAMSQSSARSMPSTRSYSTSRFYHYHHSPISTSHTPSYIPRPTSTLPPHHSGSSAATSRLPMRTLSSYGRSHSSMG